MSLALQAKLLRAVETGDIIPLGATGAEKVDVRILTATNKDLVKEVEKGNFREDLYYRLNVVTIKIPPLRERRSDIPLFIDYFIHHFNIIQEKKVTDISPEAMEVLLNHHYPGNIRELRNIMEYVFVFCSEGEIRPKHLPDYLRAAAMEPGRAMPFTSEKELILDALTRARWNKQKAAEILQVDRSTLWRKMKKYAVK
jgi:transcriptional regulator with PAS, ATPase and Fis domain